MLSDGMNELLQMRADIYDIICRMNEFIGERDTYSVSRDYAIEAREHLIDADNELNKMRLKHVGGKRK